MKTTLIATTLILLSLTASAETTTVKVDGMHCSGCEKMVSKEVCGNEQIKATSESCEVKIIDEAKQIGEIVIKTKGTASVDMEQVKAGLKKAGGDDYKVASVDIKESITKTAATTAPTEAVKTETKKVKKTETAKKAKTEKKETK